MPRITIETEESSYLCDQDDTLLRAALREGLGFPYECNVGSCGMCRYQLLSGTVEQLWLDAPAINPRDKKKQRMLGCQTRPTSDCRIKIRTNSVDKEIDPPKKFAAKLVKITHLTHDMAEFKFFSYTPPKFLPGQYALLNLPGVEGVRALSMSNMVNSDGYWCFIVKRVKGGKGTFWFFDRAAIGDQIIIDGPYGHAWLRINSERPIICLAGGAGIGAMLSIASGYYKNTLAQSSLRLYYGCRTSRDIIHKDYVVDTIRSSAEIIYSNIVSEPESSWTGNKGMLDRFLFESFEGKEVYKSFDYYMAGPPQMIESLRRGLIIERQVPIENIRYDQFY
tara:strand:+ start:3626 stop:4633 length:1008 start_codon:yes stop_codon:yes gene_type:complete